MDEAETAKPRDCACHCGGVTFTAAMPDHPRGGRCNCSICSMKGAVMIGVPLNALQVTGGEDLLRCYQFNTGVAKHWFCSRCGIHCFHQRRSDPGQYGVNAACVKGLSPYNDFPELPVSDGMNHASDGNPQRLAGWLRFEENAR
ncbi:aldehyde-activating protein [Altererythrobacter sp. B11]|uniref:GFA family protein n=1 Tax=Altererythrobacter sp. B11 TaxID=2060312 RepID=UPI000DC73A7F|nr:GFA family protein [Altererythrobacter sp. B11]BBC73627.1 aldehyde-activating protein [Altererythrobacter sp. B11]